MTCTPHRSPPSRRRTGSLLQWALLSTFAGAAITVALMRWRHALTHAASVAESGTERDGGEAAEARGESPMPVRLGRGYQPVREAANDGDGDGERASAPPAAPKDGAARSGGQCCAVQAALPVAGVQVCLLLEKVTAWMSGCAWTNVFFPSTSASYPTTWLTLKDTGVACAITLLVLAWMLLAGGQLSVEGAVEREDVESFFMVNAASFFVGWSWVVVLRDVAAVSGQVAISRPDSMVSSIAHAFGLESAEAVRRSETRAFLRALVGVLFFGPVLSVVVVYAKGVALRAYGRVGGRDVKEMLLALMTQAAARDAEGSTPSRKQRLALARKSSRQNLAAYVGLARTPRDGSPKTVPAPASAVSSGTAPPASASLMV